MLKRDFTVTRRMLKYLKVPQDNRTIEVVSLLLEEFFTLVDIKEWRNCVPVDEFFEIFHPYARESKSIIKLIEDTVNVWLMVVTLGQHLERRSREYLRNNEIFRGYILDRLGSFYVEEEIKKLDSTISSQCGKGGYTTTHRYSPGYGDFSIKAQKIFFDLAKDVIPEMRISDGYLLSPEKTVTAIKGVFKPEH